MIFRNYSDLEFCISQNLHRIPRDVDIVVGVPRSGLVAALPIALSLNVPLTDPEGLLTGKILGSGRRLVQSGSQELISSARRILVVDDSLASGTEMMRVRDYLKGAGFSDKLYFMVIYAADARHARDFVDIWLEECPIPRLFSWNMMHHSALANACVDIDGVLCVDPSEEQNDDGEKYRDFLLNATPLYLPTVRIGSLVTSRLEKYRKETEQWLSKHNIEYEKLLMWDVATKQVRQSLGTHGEFKGLIYKANLSADIFIESSPEQAYAIAQTALKPVICIGDLSLYEPSLSSLVKGTIKKANRKFKKKLQLINNTVKNKLLELNRW